MILSIPGRLTQLILRRLSDRTRWPRSTWWPISSTLPQAAIDTQMRVHEETSKTIRRLMTALMVFALFSLLAIGEPDSALIAGGVINVPFSGTSAPFIAFLFVGPLIAMGLTTYLHVFVGHWMMLPELSPGQKLPTLFNIPNRLASCLSRLIWYWLTPVILLLFSFKSLPLPQAPAVLFLSSLCIAAMLLLQIRRCPSDRRKRQNPILWVLMILVVLFAGISGWQAYAVAFSEHMRIPLYGNLIIRPLNLFRAELTAKNLSSYNLHAADLQQAELSSADLRYVNLGGANLFEAKLAYASLDFARLPAANLVGAELVHARLLEADLSDVNANSANFQYSELRGANLRGATLRFAAFDNAVLGCVRIEPIRSGYPYEICTDLRDVKGLDCDALTRAKDWADALRDASLSCGAPIPQ